MNLGIGIDSSGVTVFTANYPLPNLLCTVNFICDTLKSEDIVASSF